MKYDKTYLRKKFLLQRKEKYLKVKKVNLITNNHDKIKTLKKSLLKETKE